MPNPVTPADARQGLPSPCQPRWRRVVKGLLVCLMVGIAVRYFLGTGLGGRDQSEQGAADMVNRPVRQIGYEAGQLHGCPDSPNCVSSQCPATDTTHAIAPLEFADDWSAARERLIAVIHQLPRTRIIVAEENYLHVEFRSLIFRFVDDVEFLQDPSGGKIQVRSASRVGYSDLGANRQRIEQIRRLFSSR